MSSSSINTPIAGSQRQVMSPVLIERIIALLNEYLDSLQSEQESIEVTSADSHDEMAAEDNRWDEIDAQIMEVREVLQELGCSTVSDNTDDE